MKKIQIIGVVLTLAMIPFAAANADGKDKKSGPKKLITAPAVNQENTASSRDEDMEGFLKTVAAVDTDTRSKGPADDKDDSNQGHFERNLGLGFAHGMGNANSNSNNAGNNRGNPENNPHNDACNGNGHGDDRNNNGQGHEQWGNGNGFGHRDCGEPSPAD